MDRVSQNNAKGLSLLNSRKETINSSCFINSEKKKEKKKKENKENTVTHQYLTQFIVFHDDSPSK